jgi:HAD superfamily hydrolase (TIGR01490 family)
MSQRIAFFDFDGTITTKDTLLEFIKFSKGHFRYYLGFILNSPWLVAYRLKIISNQAAKQRILSWFFQNAPLAVFQADCDRFAEEVMPGLIRPKAIAEIRDLREKGFSIVIVSASPEHWLRKWTEQEQAGLLATRLETRPTRASKTGKAETTPMTGEQLTGKILDRNCHGHEKVRRIREAYILTEYNEILAYGDTSGDKPMLELANHSFFKPFR